MATQVVLDGYFSMWAYDYFLTLGNEVRSSFSFSYTDANGAYLSP